MHSYAPAALALAAALVPAVNAHGHVQGIVAGGNWYSGYDANFQYDNPIPEVAGWTADNLDNGFVASDAYTTADIICHKSATPGKKFVPVKAGETVELQWTAWPSSHHGPVLNYLAHCAGDCTNADKENLEFFKIGAKGLISDADVPGTWATDNLIAANNSWTVTIPSNLAPGGYVLRHEIIALHSAGSAGGAQSYPQCVNLKVTGSGTAHPCTAGAKCEKGTALYKENGPGILINIYQTLSSYSIPGPAVWSGLKKRALSFVS